MTSQFHTTRWRSHNSSVCWSRWRVEAKYWYYHGSLVQLIYCFLCRDYFFGSASWTCWIELLIVPIYFLFYKASIPWLHKDVSSAHAKMMMMVTVIATNQQVYQSIVSMNQVSSAWQWRLPTRRQSTKSSLRTLILLHGLQTWQSQLWRILLLQFLPRSAPPSQILLFARTRRHYQCWKS